MPKFDRVKCLSVSQLSIYKSENTLVWQERVSSLHRICRTRAFKGVWLEGGCGACVYACMSKHDCACD